MKPHPERYYGGVNAILFRIGAIVTSLALVTSLGLHTVEVGHIHPGDGAGHAHEDTGMSIFEYAHAGEEKIFLVALYTTALIFAAFIALRHEARFTYTPALLLSAHRHLWSGRYNDHALRTYRKGILNTKLCE